MKISRFMGYPICALAALVAAAGCNAGGSQGLAPASLPVQSGAQPASHGSPLRVTHYLLVALRGLGGNSSVANGINDRGWIAGGSNLRGNKVNHAVLWAKGKPIDLGTLGGPNSYVAFLGISDRGEIAGLSDVAQTDPLSESFCGDPTYLCLGFRWRASTMTPLPTLGGNNSQATAVNNRGEAVGVAETAVHDASCVAPQVLDYRGVIWKPNGEIVTLPPIAGDAVSQAIPIDNSGDAAGASGPCGPALNPSYGTTHAVLWKHGAAIDLGSLGGTTFNAAGAMNDHGQIVGISGLPGNTTFHAFLWQHGVMSDLGTLPGDVQSYAFGINNRGQIVGQSCDASGNCRAFIWQNGSMTDLNLLVPNGRLYLTGAFDINDSGQIVGSGFNTKTGRAPAFVAIPGGAADVGPGSSAPRVVLPERLRMQFAHRHSFRPILTP